MRIIAHGIRPGLYEPSCVLIAIVVLDSLRMTPGCWKPRLHIFAASIGGLNDVDKCER
jgi:hypothetical protein